MPVEKRGTVFRARSKAQADLQKNKHMKICKSSELQDRNLLMFCKVSGQS